MKERIRMTTQLHNISILKDTRKFLRENMTEAEVVLWEVLKEKKLNGRKFRRQHSIGYYIADFYCPSERLIIELDGQQHYTPDGILKDRERDKHLSEMNITVLRFENKAVLNDLSQVLQCIKSYFKPGKK